MSRAAFLAGVALMAAAAGAAADTLSEMTEKIDRAAEVMGSPHDAVSPALQGAYPDMDVTSYTTCVARHATPDELALLSGDFMGEGTSPSELAAAIAARPETVDCLTLEGLPRLPE